MTIKGKKSTTYTITSHNAGTVTEYTATDGSSWTQYIFTNTVSGHITFNCTATTTVGMLCIAGGGGGAIYGGGGGAGGFRQRAFNLPVGTETISTIVGAKGQGNFSNNTSVLYGGNSSASFATNTAYNLACNGGGGGCSQAAGGNGGSGGGSVGKAGGTGIAGEGNAGGNSPNVSWTSPAGGGGAGGVGGIGNVQLEHKHNQKEVLEELEKDIMQI